MPGPEYSTFPPVDVRICGQANGGPILTEYGIADGGRRREAAEYLSRAGVSARLDVGMAIKRLEIGRLAIVSCRHPSWMSGSREHKGLQQGSWQSSWLPVDSAGRRLAIISRTGPRCLILDVHAREPQVCRHSRASS